MRPSLARGCAADLIFTALIEKITTEVIVGMEMQLLSLQHLGAPLHSLCAAGMDTPIYRPFLA